MPHNNAHPTDTAPLAVPARKDCLSRRPAPLIAVGEPAFGRALAAKTWAATLARRSWVTWDGPTSAPLSPPRPPALLRAIYGHA